ncbi:MAG TPA: cohesin domain-containing protein [Candidatus Acidoferrales bacterium]|nr:cohesin domain-containing protein [Candidatus Acidoferrales bacterium]
MRRALMVSFVAVAVTFVAGCPKGNQDYKVGRKAELAGDYDTAVVSYARALKSDPGNAEYKLRSIRAHFEAGQFHVEQGEKDLNKGQLEMALAEFQKAEGIDPSSAIASQEAQKTLDLLAKVKEAEQPKPVGVAPPEDTGLMSAPPELKPLSREPINLKMGPVDARVVFSTIGQLAGLSVIFDPSYVSRQISVDLPNVTLEQGLDAVALESDAFWKPVTSNIILVAPDNPQTRLKLQDEQVQTFYLRNTTTPAELTEITNGLRQLLDITRLQPVAADNAIVMRTTPDKLILASKIIDSLDKAKPEVMIQVDVLEARLDREHELGIQPPQSLTVTGTPRSAIQPQTSTSGSTGTSTPTTPQVTLNNLKHLSTADYSLTLPGATLNALLTDSTTRVIQDPTIRVTDGATAKLSIGDQVPIAVSTLTPGIGVAAGGSLNTLGSTSFQYKDVGVIISVTPRVHPDGEVSLNYSIEVSSVTSQSNIGGIQQPIISSRKIGPADIRLRDGEVNLLGGLITRSETKSLNGWPGVAHIPFLRYFFSNQDNKIEDDEVLIAMTPHVVRMPSITADDLRTLAAGTDTNVRVFQKEVDGPNATVAPPSAQNSAAPTGAAGTTPPAPGSPVGSASTSLQFQPASISLKPGDTMTVGLAIDNAHDLFSIPLLLKYDPAVIQIEDIRNGGFLSGGTQEIAVVHQEDQQQGQAIVSATRRPNTPGISGTGTLLGIVIKAIAPGTSQLQVVQVNARDSQQKPLPITSGTATIQVQ